MKVQALKRFRAKLANNEPIYGFWVTLESATITEMAVALGFDWVVIDAEHGHLDWKDINDHIRAALRSDTVVLIRLAERNTSLTKRALDIGADGLVIPLVETTEQLREAIRDSRYPPEGRRGIGGERATVWGQCFAKHTSEANDHVLVVPLIESVGAVPHLPEMCRVEGAEVFFIGPADFSASAGYRGQWEGPGVAEQIIRMKETIHAAGKHCGLMTTSISNLIERRDQGFRMLSLGSDCGLLLRSIHQALQVVDRDLLPAPSLDPKEGTRVRLTLDQPPIETTPDRDEVMTALGGAITFEPAPGVLMQAMVGGFNTARSLTTGMVTIQPGAILPYHTHPGSESITIIEGQAEIEVEGRSYRLGPMDNITIPRWLPHQARNPNAHKPARLHVALAMTVPQRDMVQRSFEVHSMQDDSTGLPGFERVTRFLLAERLHGVGPNAEFIDYFNALLIPGIEMSGGYARFQPGGRLPDHLHDFDESICIISGDANCLVEGRKYSLKQCATAMIPRGRVHYFINESKGPMEMIWVYAGPMPERILISPGFQRPLFSSQGQPE